MSHRYQVSCPGKSGSGGDVTEDGRPDLNGLGTYTDYLHRTAGGWPPFASRQKAVLHHVGHDFNHAAQHPPHTRWEKLDLTSRR